MVGLIVNLVVYIVVSLVTRNRISDEEKAHVDELFEVAAARRNQAAKRKSFGLDAKIGTGAPVMQEGTVVGSLAKEAD